MTTLSLRLPDELLHEVDTFAGRMNLPRAAYVRQALERMNHQMAAQERHQRLMETSLRVREESMRINAEFTAIEDVPHA